MSQVKTQIEREQIMNRKKIATALIFDMDGLMLDTERMAQRAWQQAGAAAGYTFTPEIYLQAVGRTKADTAMLFRQSFGSDFPFDALYEQKTALLLDMLEREPIPTKRGLFDLLDFLEQWGVRKAVATSTHRTLALHKLARTGLLDRFEHVTAGDEVAHGKPAPDIFLASADALSVTPADCFVLEDSEAGVRAAHAAGMQVIAVPDLKQPSAQVAALATAVVDSLKEVIELLSEEVREA